MTIRSKRAYYAKATKGRYGTSIPRSGTADTASECKTRIASAEEIDAMLAKHGNKIKPSRTTA